MLNRSWHAILDSEHNVVPVDIITWARFFEYHNRIVAQTQISGLFVSTVFLGINHHFFGGSPLWFETMVFEDKDGAMVEKMQWRYATWKEAEEGHNRVITIIKEGKELTTC